MAQPYAILLWLAKSEQWGNAYEGQTIALNISASILAIVGMHEGTTKQVVSFSNRSKNWVGTEKDNYLFYIVITK